MKKVLLITALIQIGALASAQDFLKIGDEWIIETQKYWSPVLTTYGIATIKIEKDTLINNKTYYKAVATRDEPCNLFGLIDFYRKEDGRVYQLSNDKETDLLILDFNESNSFNIENDWSANPSTLHRAQVDSFGITKFPSGHELETQYLNIDDQTLGQEYFTAVYDRIGYERGFLVPPVGLGLCDPFDEPWFEYKCFIRDNDTIRMTERGCFEFEMIDSNIEVPSESIDLYPNPTDSYLVVPSAYEIESIYDIYGNKHDAFINHSKLKLDHFINGIYILILRNKSKIYHARILKI